MNGCIKSILSFLDTDCLKGVIWTLIQEHVDVSGTWGFGDNTESRHSI